MWQTSCERKVIYFLERYFEQFESRIKLFDNLLGTNQKATFTPSMG